MDDFGSNPGESGAQALLYAYPDNGQGEVPTKAPIALRFTSNVAPGNVNQSVTLCCDDAGENLDFEVERVGGEPRGVLLTPTDGLAPGTQYTVEINDLRLGKGTAKDQTLTFTTRTLQEGPKSAVVQEVPAGEDEFQLSRTIPNGSELEPVMDFSAFRFQFTQPIDRATASYGDGNSVVLRDSEGAVVEAGLLVDGAYMTVDPTDDYLNPGETYTLTLGGLESTYGETFAGETLEFTPKDSSPRGEPGFLVQKITQSGTSRLTGKGINQVPVNGTLLGEDVNVTQAQSDFVIAELADVTQYTDVTPIRLPKGTLLEGTPIEMVKIGGEVDAGFGSGDVTMRVLSDATGYLVPNPYTDHQDNLRIVHLFMDVGIATANPKANGGFTQNLMHIHLVGVAEVDPNGGVLNIDATGMVEPDILGQEYGYGVLSFQLQSYKNQSNGLLADARAILKDETAPQLLSWMPGPNIKVQKPSDPIIFNFNEPLDPESATNQIQLLQNGTPMGIDYYVDGSALVITPKTVRTDSSSGGKTAPTTSLAYSPQNSPNEYTVEVGTGLSDVEGNNIATVISETFELATVVDKSQIPAQRVVDGGSDPFLDHRMADYAPNIIAAYPGYPCALSYENQSLADGHAGQCAGGYIEAINDPNATENDKVDADDIIPVMDMPANRPIILEFSDKMDIDSIILGTTLFVEEITENNDFIENVEGELFIHNKTLKFMPNQPWEKDAYYRYRLLSSGYIMGTEGTGGANTPLKKIKADANYTCGTDTICSSAGLPLQTQPMGSVTIAYIGETGSERNYATHLTGPEPSAGGPDFIQFFKGAAPTENVLQHLTTAPISDLNGNFFHEQSNPDTSTIFEPVPGFEVVASAGEYDFTVEEYGPTEESTDIYPEYDPGGLKPGKNSAKILSRYSSFGTDPEIKGVNIGCSYLDNEADDPLSCPEHKFTYLISSIIAEVTDEIVNGEIKVLMWPSVVLSTSMDVYALTSQGSALTNGIPGNTGKQILRMRFNSDDEDVSERNAPVTGWIYEEDGELMLRASLDLYVDVPYVTEWGVGSSSNVVNLRSYPISMDLEGAVTFLDDGRMSVEQFNTAPVDITLRLHSRTSGNLAGYGDMFIPERGSRLNFISQPIK